MAMQSPCVLGLAGETLSAWRDEALEATTMHTVAIHVKTCQRCQRQLAQFDMIAQALQRQRPPDLHDRVWRGVQVEHGTAPRGGSARHLSRLGSAGAVVALLVVVVVVFAALHANHATHPTTTATATTTTLPTATTVQSSTFVPATQAWRNFPKATLPQNNTSVNPTDLLPDGSGYLGEGYQGQNKPDSIVKVLLPSGNVQTLYTPARQEAFTVLGDGRFVAWDGDYLFTGAGNNFPYQSVGYLDTQTGVVTTLIADRQGPTDDSPVHAVDQGYFVWARITPQGEDLDVTDMAHGVTTRIAALSVDSSAPSHNGATAGGLGLDMNMHFSWPYVFYSYNGQQHLYNVTSGKDVILSQIQTSGFDFNAFALDGTTLFWMHTSSANTYAFALDAIAHSDQAGAQPTSLATFPRPYRSSSSVSPFIYDMSANSRLVVWSDGNGSYAWDRAQGRLVQIYAAPVQHTSTSDPYSNVLTNVLLHGTELMYTSGTFDGTPTDTTTTFNFVNTAQLPTS